MDDIFVIKMWAKFRQCSGTVKATICLHRGLNRGDVDVIGDSEQPVAVGGRECRLTGSNEITGLPLKPYTPVPEPALIVSSVIALGTSPKLDPIVVGAPISEVIDVVCVIVGI